MWFFSGGSSDNGSRSNVVSKYDEQVPPPPGGSIVPLPKAPRKFGSGINDDTNNIKFTGFSPPPRIKDSRSYDADDYSGYLMNEEPYNTGSSADKLTGVFDKIISNNRARSCLESVKLGWKMGGAVGGIFGTLTGIYASVYHRNLMLLPVSAVGGAVSFGFFLGCGMIVRC